MSGWAEFFKVLMDSGLLTAAFIIGAIALIVALIGKIPGVTPIELSGPRSLGLALFGLLMISFAIVGSVTTAGSGVRSETIVLTTAAGVPKSKSTQAAPYHPTCNWANDWELQSDGSYLWRGFPPGSPDCQNVGQAGELLQRLRDGENLTLVVEVGDTPIGLDICRGEYTATTVSSGETCVPRNPELWPKVTGKLIVTGSDGFLVGTGK